VWRLPVPSALQLAQNARSRFSALVPDFSKCNTDIPALIMRGYDKIAQGSAEIEASTTLSSDFQREFVLQRDKPGYRESEDSLCSAYSGYYIAYRGLNVSTLQYRSDACSTAYLTASYPFLLNLTCKLLEVAVGARCGAGRGQRFCFVFSATIVFSQLPRPVEVCGPFQAGVSPPVLFADVMFLFDPTEACSVLACCPLPKRHASRCRVTQDSASVVVAGLYWLMLL
jgi:hypothetical protein